MAVGIAATSALMIAGPGSTAATAGRLIGSAAIKNNTIRSLDIRNETITGRDIKDGSITANDLSGALGGATGPRGPVGPAGQDGTATAASTISAWHVAHQAGPPYFTLAGSDVPAGTQVEVVDLTVTGDLTSCTSGFTLKVRLGEGRELGAISRSWQGIWQPAVLTGGGYITPSASPILLNASCLVGTGDQAPVPAFDATVTLAMTQRDTTPTASYN